MSNKPIAQAALALAAAFFSISLWAQSAPAAPPVRLRGVIEKVEPGQLTLKERNGQTIVLAWPDNTPISEVVTLKLSDIGTAAMPQPDGSQRALEVSIFPEAARGTGEGHFPWDLMPQSTMTNAAVAELVSSSSGNTLKLKYKDGEKTLIVPPDVPVVTFKPGDKSLLVPGAKVMINAQSRDGKPTALRISAGRDGVGPPM